MTNKSGWQFPDNNCTDNNGLEDAGIETFAGDADGGLAREICQNSIDANNKKEKPTRVEFAKFKINASEIPGREELLKEIEECCYYKGEDDKEGKQLKLLRKTILQEEIECLRISDFNTTGLVGIMDDENDSPFYLLTKGSGTSGKTEGNGGSKGIGKYACFVASGLNTVFYSTKAFNKEKCREEIGYIGISKLRSRPMHNPNRPNLMTMGRGYYASNSDNAPFHEELNLDPNFKRGEEEYGTDVYVIGYSSKDWIANITYKILEGFMASIVFDGFEVKVDGQLINKETLSTIVNSDLFKNKSANDRRYIKAMLSLFDEEGVQKREFIIGKDSKIRIFVRSYNQKNESEASKRCEFIRYPYMRIKKIGIQTLLPYSAMCIIEKNDLCEKLRKIEDPVHTEWQFNRLDYFGFEEKKKTTDLYNQMEKTVRDFIYDCLQMNKGEETDFEGASEYLPADDSDEAGNDASTKEAISTTPVRRIRVNTPKTSKASEDGMGPEFSTGDPNGNEEGVEFPGVNPDTPPNPNPNPKPPVDDENRGGKEGDIPAIIKVPLGGMKYKAIYDAKKKNIDIVFVSKYNEDNCELSIRQVGLNDDRYDINVVNATINDKPCIVDNGVVKDIRIIEGMKYKISCEVNIYERFASEVVLNAIR